MDEVFYLYNMDLLIGRLTKKEGQNLYLEMLCKRDCQRLRQFKALNMLDGLSDEEISKRNLFVALVSTRVFDSYRVDIQSILHKLHLTYYDEWEIFKSTSGLCIDDCMWISKSDRVGYTFFRKHIAYGPICKGMHID